MAEEVAEEQAKKIRTAQSIVAAQKAALATWGHGEECGAHYQSPCDCGLADLQRAFEDLSRVLGGVR